MSNLLFNELHPAKGITQSVYRIESAADCERKPNFKWKKVRINTQDGKDISWFSSIHHFFQEVFLPRGYPDSVCTDYMAYQIWDSLQAFGSSITNTLATHNVLKGIGVGDESASVMSATLTWLLRDGTGMLGRIGFTYLKGSDLDVNCKKWRLFADIINDCAIGLDMVCPLFPNYLLLVQCSSGFLKSLVGTIGGATRAALTQHQARANNLADVSAKDASQETLVNLSALVVSLIMMPLLDGSDRIIWTLFFILTFFHVYCNYRAVRAVNMEVFNPSRYALFIGRYIKGKRIPSIAEVNQAENIWFFKTNLFDDFVKSGVPLSDHFVHSQSLNQIAECSDKWGYFLSFDRKRSIPVYISFFKDKDSPIIKLKAYYHAYLLFFEGFNNLIKLKDESEVEAAGNVVSSFFSDLIKDASMQNWNTSNFIHLEDGWRISIHDKKTE